MRTKPGDCNKKIISNVLERFSVLNEIFGFSNPIIKTDRYKSEIYFLFHGHALETEIDWCDRALFVYGVRLIDGKLPDDSVIYNYDDGQRCRTFIEDIYHVKGFDCKKCRKKYSDECFYCALDFYTDTIRANPNLLIDFLCG